MAEREHGTSMIDAANSQLSATADEAEAPRSQSAGKSKSRIFHWRANIHRPESQNRVTGQSHPLPKL